MFFGLIPAGGSSQRMGQPKLLLPWRGQPLLHWIVTAFREAGIPRTLVVLAPDRADCVAIVERAGGVALLLSEPTLDMRSTIEAGLDWIETQWQPTDADRVAISPADQPRIASTIVDELCRHSIQRPGRAIVPMCDGRRGHPLLLPWSLVSGLRQHQTNEGVNAYLRGLPMPILEIPVEDVGHFEDVDTPEDYQRLLKSE